MKNFTNAFIYLTGICFMVFISGGLSFAQPKIPKEKIPSDIPSDVREAIERLYLSDPVSRARVAIELGKMGAGAVPAIPFLIGMLGDSVALEWRGVRAGYSYTTSYTAPGIEASAALVKIGQPAVQPLIAALKDKDSVVRKRAAWALGEIKDPRAVEPLITALKEEDWEDRNGVAWALGKIGRSAVGGLIAALKDEAWQVRSGAARALGVITEQDFGEDPAKWQGWWEENK